MLTSRRNGRQQDSGANSDRHDFQDSSAVAKSEMPSTSSSNINPYHVPGANLNLILRNHFRRPTKGPIVTFLFCFTFISSRRDNTHTTTTIMSEIRDNPDNANVEQDLATYEELSALETEFDE